jgi:hypothetical protein
VHVETAARRTVELLDAPSGIVEITDERARARSIGDFDEPECRERLGVAVLAEGAKERVKGLGDGGP